MPIAVPQGVDVSITAEQITVKGRWARWCAVNELVTIKNDGGTVVRPANDAPKPTR